MAEERLGNIHSKIVGVLSFKQSELVYWPFLALSTLLLAHYGALDNAPCMALLLASAISYQATLRSCVGDIALPRSTIKLLRVATICLAFELAGPSLFLDELCAMVLLSRFAVLLIVAFGLFPSVYGAYVLFVKVRGLIRKHAKSYSKKQVIIIQTLCSAIIAVVGLASSLAWYPCTMTNDSIDHWSVASSDEVVSDYQPLAYTLLLRVLLGSAATPYPYVIFQIALLAFFVCDAAGLLARCGVSRTVIVLGTITFSLMPPSFLLPLYLSKNPLCAILCAWVTLALSEVIMLPNWYSSRPIWFVKTVFSFAGLFLIRENNTVIIIPMLLMLAWLFWKKNYTRKAVLVSACAATLVICCVNAFAYVAIEHTHVNKSHETVRPLLAPAASALKQGLELPDEVSELMTRVLPREEWVKRYDPYNSDGVTWGEPRPNYEAVSIGEAFFAYLLMFERYPAIVVKDRLDASSIVWSVDVPGIIRYPSGLVGDVSFAEKGAFQDVGGLLQRLSNELRKLFNAFVSVSVEDSIVDVMVWRCGPYIVLLFILAAVLVEEKRSALLWAISPSCAILGTYILVIAWQMYFYVWFFPLSVATLVIVALAIPTAVNCGDINHGIQGAGCINNDDS